MYLHSLSGKNTKPYKFLQSKRRKQSSKQLCTKLAGCNTKTACRVLTSKTKQAVIRRCIQTACQGQIVSQTFLKLCKQKGKQIEKVESGTRQFCHDAHRATMAHGTQNFVPCACFCYQKPVAVR